MLSEQDQATTPSAVAVVEKKVAEKVVRKVKGKLTLTIYEDSGKQDADYKKIGPSPLSARDINMAKMQVTRWWARFRVTRLRELEEKKMKGNG